MSTWDGSFSKPPKPPEDRIIKEGYLEEIITLPSFKASHKKWAGLILGIMGGFGTLQTLMLPLLIELPISLGVGGFVAVLCYFVMGLQTKTKTIKVKDQSSSKSIKEAIENISLISEFAIKEECKIFEAKIERVTDIVNELITELYSRQDKIFDSRDFLGFYLDAIITILANYCKITNVQEKAKRAKEIDDLLDNIHNPTKEKIESFDRSSTVKLDTEITLLSNELKSKGF